MTTERVLVGDVIPYDAPVSLADLRGPATGEIMLPLSVYWGPDSVCNLENPDDLVKAYQALVREGSPAEQAALLNEVLLRRVWPSLVLPVRCRRLWEARHGFLLAAA